MGTLSIWHILIMVAFVAIFMIPAWRILNRVGLSGWWSLLYLVPFVNIIVFWIFAFMPWPALQQESN